MITLFKSRQRRFNLICVCVCNPIGYANEVGESFRALVPVSLVWATYGVSTAYVTADAVDKGKKAAMVRYLHLFYVVYNIRTLEV